MPRIKTTPMVRIALWALRVYLLILLALIGLKFARVFSHSSNPNQPNGPGASTQDQPLKAAQ
ncbi:MAG TPA: hypothetical protein VGW37_18135 [Terriglobia bacterium]|nr:hypothetical protein [Terriglobia bacterium]